MITDEKQNTAKIVRMAWSWELLFDFCLAWKYRREFLHTDEL